MIAYYLHPHTAEALDRAHAVVASLPPDTTVVSPHPAPLGWGAPWHRADDGSAESLLSWIEAHQPASMIIDGTALHVRAATARCERVAVIAPPGGGDGGELGPAFSAADLILAPWSANAPAAAWPRAWRRRTLYLGAVGEVAARAVAARPVRPASPANPAAEHWRCLHVAPHAAGPEPRERRDMLAETPGWQWSFVGERDLTHDGPVWDALLRCDVLVCAPTSVTIAAAAAAGVPTVLVVPDRPSSGQSFLANVARHTAPVVVAARPHSPSGWRTLLAEARGLDDRDGQGWDAWAPGPGLQALASTLGAGAPDPPHQDTGLASASA